MLPIEPLGLSANQWKFLSAPHNYVKASVHSDRKLVGASTRRQFKTARDILARLNGSHGVKPCRGILLADDVGLGKTTVAALVAWVVASAGEKRKVRILAPNDVMMRRWVDELKSHVDPLQECAQHLGVNKNRVKAGRVGRLAPGSIQVVKFSYAASEERLDCDLLIIDEAHRAKGEGSKFSKALKKQIKNARRVLILTATPFSIRLDELRRMLTLIGGESAHRPVATYSRALDDLYSGNTVRNAEVVAERLAAKAKAAVEALSSFVIRHGIDDLPDEQSSFGDRLDWSIDVPSAKPKELELMVRMDRALRVAKDASSESSKATNDPRFHVGWRHFDEVREQLSETAQQLAEPVKAVVENQLKAIKRLRSEVGIHSKMAAVGEAVYSTIKQGEKVVLFCHHHKTAQELTVHLDSVLPKVTTPSWPVTVWMKAWSQVLRQVDHEYHDEELRETFIKWLCADLIRAQTWSWLREASASEGRLVDSLNHAKARHPRGPETIAEAASRLYVALLDSKSSRAVLKESEHEPNRLPGANGASRVLGVCEESDREKEKLLFIQNQQPDTVISVFNSPFGPDVLVVTDKLSEGIDLHRYCRHLIHYELDPSPIRTVQRNGRIRRVNSWAAATHQEILYAYPAFRGTRDHRLVQIMKKRIDSFSLLLGGVQDFDVEGIVDSEEKWRNDVIKDAQARLAKVGRQLRAKESHS